MNQAVFDTNILIDFSRNCPEAVRLVENCHDRLISLVTWIEFLVGTPSPILEQTKIFLRDNFEIVYPDAEIAEETASIRRSHRLKFPDAMIYATAKAVGMHLITRNTKDFDETTPGVHIPYRM